MKQRWILVLAIVLAAGLAFMNGCGSSGGSDDAGGGDDGTETPAEPSVTYSSSDTCRSLFAASGNICFAMSHAGEFAYKFQVINLKTQLPAAIMAAGSGDFDGTVCVNLTSNDYTLNVESQGTWQVDVYGSVSPYADPDCDEDTDDGDEDTDEDFIDESGCNCQGCCSDRGGVICFQETTMCRDGTPLSDVCIDQGCIALGCPGCEP